LWIYEKLILQVSASGGSGQQTEEGAGSQEGTTEGQLHGHQGGQDAARHTLCLKPGTVCQGSRCLHYGEGQATEACL